MKRNIHDVEVGRETFVLNAMIAQMLIPRSKCSGISRYAAQNTPESASEGRTARTPGRERPVAPTQSPAAPAPSTTLPARPPMGAVLARLPNNHGLNYP